MAEKLNGPGFGARMSTAGQPMLTGDVARQAIARQAEEFRQAMERVQAVSNALQEQSRELVSYCQQMAEGAPDPGMAWAFADVRDKLSEILDGEQ